MNVALKGAPHVSMFDGLEVRDWGLQDVEDDARPLETVEAYVTEVRCPKCGLEGRSIVSMSLAHISGDAIGFRAAEDKVFAAHFRRAHASKTCEVK